MLHPTRLLVAAGACLLASLSLADLIKREQQPSISPDGGTVAFSWQGDIWKVPAAGGRAVRLTVHPAIDANPHWTPDGKRIVFSSTRYGSQDVFVMDADGSDLKRLTFDSGAEVPASISPDGKFVFGTTSDYSRQDCFRLPITGGDVTRLTDHPLEYEYLPVVSPDGKTVAYCRGSYATRAWQKPGIKSSALADIWLADNTAPLSNHKDITPTEANEEFAQWGPDGTIYFISNRSGWPNVWRMNRDGGAAKQITKHTDGTARYLSVSADGKWAVYEFESDLYRLNTASGETKKVDVDVAADERFNPVVDLDVTDKLSDYAIAPDGKRAAIVVRGDIFVLPEKGGTTRRLTDSPRPDLYPVFLDAKTVLYSRAGANGLRQLATVTVDGTKKDFVTTTEDAIHPVLSPDSKTIAFQLGRDKIALVPASGGTPRVVVHGNFAESFQGDANYSWSPDSKWLVVATPTDRSTNVIVTEVATGKQVTVARMPHGTNAPRFLPNGRSVYFLADDNRENNLYIIDLVPPEVRFTEDDLDRMDEAPKKPGEVKVEVYEPNIENRLRKLTTDATIDAQASADSRSIYANVKGAVVAIPVSGGPARPFDGVAGNAVGFNLVNGNLYYVVDGKLNALGGQAPAARPIPYSAHLTINLRDEEKALFDEIWWAMDRLYYDETFHGKNWGAIKSKYEKIVPYTYDRTDFYNLMGEMMEELDSSHLGSTAPPEPQYPGVSTEPTGYLGVDYDPVQVSQGRYVISHVFAGSPADNPQTQLKLGDQIVGVDGVAPTGDKPLSALLANKAGKRVRLSVMRNGAKAEVAIRPGSPAQRQAALYEDWVQQERALVDKLSNGQLAYLHIQGMDQPSLEKFRQEIRTRTQGKKGVVIDVRYNGGGNTAQDILNILIKQPWLIRTARGPEGFKLSENIYRGDSLELPTITLVNSYSFSNAEIWAEGFRRLKRGLIVGERTPGYVIGTGAYALWDGGMIRMPGSGAYTIEGQDLENNGRKPDISVPFDPNAWMQGRDPQMEKAVQELLKEIGK